MAMHKNEMLKRSAGILMAVSSLPSPYGIGTLGKAAYEFVDFVKNAGHKYWQVLPQGPLSFGDSPYQSFSVFAGNPYYIDLDILVDEGLLTRSYLKLFDWGDGYVPVEITEEEAKDTNFHQEIDFNLGNESYVDYAKIYNSRFSVLSTAYERFRDKSGETDLKYEVFVQENSFWLDDYALFMACKSNFGNEEWSSWPDGIKFRKPDSVKKYTEKLSDDIAFWKFCQFEFDSQWKRLKKYANFNGIDIIGDIPIYTANDSADVWADTKLFQLDRELAPEKVAGVPPDAFTELGQKWGNPLYDWDEMEKDGFVWWKNRMKKSADMYDVIRIDHFIGLAKYYSVPAESEDARSGEYRNGPGKKLTDVINKAIGEKKIIAENLGVAMPEADELLEINDYPPMQVIEFAFDGGRDNPHLPHNYKTNSVVYGGTHDNETLQGFFDSRTDEQLKYAFDYLDTKDRKKIVDKVFRAAYGSVAALAIFQAQDILRLDNSARMNFPSTFGENWKWRLKKGQLTQKHAEELRNLADIFGR